VREQDRKVLVFGISWVAGALVIMIAFLATAVFSLDW
jgi:hypothetical protein